MVIKDKTVYKTANICDIKPTCSNTVHFMALENPSQNIDMYSFMYSFMRKCSKEAKRQFCLFLFFFVNIRAEEEGGEEEVWHIEKTE